MKKFWEKMTCGTKKLDTWRKCLCLTGLGWRVAKFVDKFKIRRQQLMITTNKEIVTGYLPHFCETKN